MLPIGRLVLGMCLCGPSNLTTGDDKVYEVEFTVDDKHSRDSWPLAPVLALSAQPVFMEPNNPTLLKISG
jgi:hypothetical protein